MRFPWSAVSMLCVACGGTAESGGPWVAPDAGTLNSFSARIFAPTATRLDLLFVIDNSISMADKQQILELAVPQLVNRFIDPICVDRSTDPPVPTADTSSLDGCTNGEPEFRALRDLHIGIITSSLGGHGGELCSPAHGPNYWNETQNDAAHLITRTRDGATAPTWNDTGFLAWDPGGTGESDPLALVSNFRSIVTGAGESGCGFAAPLEAWYRFLVDPEPSTEVVVNPSTQLAEPRGIDQVVLDQRSQFVRPDSLLLVVMVSDDDDASFTDSGYGYFATSPTEGTMPKSTSACDANPNDPCCVSCIQASAPDGCTQPAADPKCQAGVYLPREEDRICMRDYDMKRRFGIDLLYPTGRYVDGLVEHQVPNRAGEMVPNPLFAPNPAYPDLPPRLDSSGIYLAGIVGVPWQDIATEDTLNDPARLRYLTADRIAQDGIWDQILGDPSASPPIPPSDPFMQKSIQPRTGSNPRTGIAIAPPVEGPGGPAINGHEYQINNACDLQYACIFPLTAPKDCSTVAAGVGCDCKTTNEISMRPLCNGTQQLYAKAYPALRQLEVLKGYGMNSIVASICPKNMAAAPTDASYGYSPAAAAVIDRLAREMQEGGSCLPRSLPLQADGSLSCVIVEVTQSAYAAPCAAADARAEVSAVAVPAIRRKLVEDGICTGDCADVSMCQILPAGPSPTSVEYQECLDAPDDASITGAHGYCYIDCPIPGSADCVGDPALVQHCPASMHRQLRFVSPPGSAPIPRPGSALILSCQG
jgi:hypothetical protein